MKIVEVLFFSILEKLSTPVISSSFLRARTTPNYRYTLFDRDGNQSKRHSIFH